MPVTIPIARSSCRLTAATTANNRYGGRDHRQASQHRWGCTSGDLDRGEGVRIAKNAQRSSHSGTFLFQPAAEEPEDTTGGGAEGVCVADLLVDWTVVGAHRSHRLDPMRTRFSVLVANKLNSTALPRAIRGQDQSELRNAHINSRTTESATTGGTRRHPKQRPNQHRRQSEKCPLVCHRPTPVRNNVKCHCLSLSPRSRVLSSTA